MKNSNKSWLIKTGIIALAVIATFSYINLKKQQLAYTPFVTNNENLNLNIIEPSPIMEGTPNGDLMIATPMGSKIFAKGGLNYVIASEGKDELFYSLCSTKIIEGKVNVIEGFNPKHDKLKIFCAHNHILPSAIRIIHDQYKRKPITYVEIQGKHSLTAIALIGDIDINVDDIILNERWVAPAKPIAS